MRISTLPHPDDGQTELGVVYASIEGVNEKSYDECLHELKEKAKSLGASQLAMPRSVRSARAGNRR